MVLLEDGSARVREAGREGGEEAKEGAGDAGRVRESSDIPVILPVIKNPPTSCSALYLEIIINLIKALLLITFFTSNSACVKVNVL